jgi:hypothetical protein
MQNPTHVKLSIELVNRTLEYLSTKPFNEVSLIIFEIKNQAEASVQEQMLVKFPVPNTEGQDANLSNNS